MRIAVDAMGGDKAPREVVLGAVRAARELTGITRIVLVGDESAIRAELNAGDGLPTDRLEILHASEVVGMDESPALAVRRKKDSSIGRAVELVKHGEADAVVSAGNTGAVVAAATLKLRLIEGVDRPGIATLLPTRGRPLLLMDAGATIDCTALQLSQFAVMGAVYAESIVGHKDPIVGLMSIGGEEVKGNDVTKRAYRLIDELELNFRGNVEGHDLFNGDLDVVICDGFVGNVVLKTTESVAHAIGHWLKKEFVRNPVRMLGALLLKGALKSMKQRMDPELYGGAPLLGVNGVCIITHGSTSQLGVFHAIRVASESVHQQLNDLVADRIHKASES